MLSFMVSTNHREIGENEKQLCNYNKNTTTIDDLKYFPKL
jgi:hypothetical protein